ncbi:MAG: hydroxyacid dehydrogenase [Acidobacteriota bacterium]
MKILISDAFDPSLPGRLASFGEAFDDKSRLAEAEVVLIRSKTKVTREYLQDAPNLKLVIRGGVGLDNVDRAACKEKGVEVRNTPQASSVAVAELVLTLMLSAVNRVVDAHNSMGEGKWLKKELKRTELMGKKLGLVGVGRIGTEVALRAKAFGMKITGYDPYLQHHDTVELRDSLGAVLADADYLSLHTPLTDETAGMINRETISRMKNGVIIVNTARGKLVSEEDMAGALKEGKVRALATDVWYSDPPDPGSPLLTAPNVLMTPHIGASTKENLLRIGDVIVEILSGWEKK